MVYFERNILIDLFATKLLTLFINSNCLNIFTTVAITEARGNSNEEITEQILE